MPRFGDTKLSKVTREEIERWRAERLASVAGGTVNKELVRMKHLLNRAVAWRYLRESPAKDIQKVKESPGRVRYLTLEERAALIREANPTLRAYIMAALHTGARRGELLGLLWEDVDFRAGMVTFRQTKNGDRRTIPMNETLRGLLTAIEGPRDPAGRVLPVVTPEALTIAFGRLAKRLGLKGLRFHDLRHDAASTLTMAGVPQRTVMEILGHRDPRMTLRYQHLAPAHMSHAMTELERSERDENTPSSLGTISAP